MKKIILTLFISHMAFSAQAKSALNCPEGSEIAKKEIASGHIEECLSKATSKTEGPRLEYDAKGILRRSWNFKNGIPDGEFKVFDEKKQVTKEGKFVNGLLEGKMLRWYSKGHLQDETNWLNGRPHGPVKRYSPNGNVMEAGNYQAGRRVGIWNFKKEDGAALPPRNYGDDIQGEPTLQSFGATVVTDKADDQSLVWEPLADVEKKQNKEGSSLNARVEAKAKGDGWAIEYRDQILHPWDLEQRRFTIDVPLEGQETKVKVTAVGPENKKITYPLTIVSKSPEYISKVEAETSTPNLMAGTSKPSQLMATMGVSQHDYSEGSSIKNNYANLSFGLILRHQFSSPQFEFLTVANYEGINLKKPTSGGALNFFNLDGSFGYLTGNSDSGLRVGAFAGLFYRTSNGENYGVRNLMGPKFSPNLRIMLSETQSISATYHWAPILVESKGLDPSSEVESGFELSWLIRLTSGKVLSINLDSTALKINKDESKLDSKTNRISVGYGF